MLALANGAETRKPPLRGGAAAIGQKPELVGAVVLAEIRSGRAVHVLSRLRVYTLQGCIIGAVGGRLSATRGSPRA